MTKTILAVSLAAIFVFAAIALPIGSADARESFLTVKKAKVVTNDDKLKKAQFNTADTIPTDGTMGAFGYGIISGAGLEAISVSVTHAGVQDSEAQADANDPVFHNHYVALQDSQADGTGYCPGLEVRDITWEQPGTAKIDRNKSIMKHIPYSFEGTDSLTGADLSFLADGNIGAAVAFLIDPVDATGETNPNDIQAVCINDVISSAELKVREK